jgi:hypothetical protein
MSQDRSPSEERPPAEKRTAAEERPPAEKRTAAEERPPAEDRTAGQELSVIETLPGLARLAADVWWRTTLWGLGASLRASTRLARVALDPGAAAEFVQEFSAGMRGYAREFLGIADLDDRVRQMAPINSSLSRRGRRNGSEPEHVSLRTQGAELLRQAADVGVDDDIHPAYARILTELAPDEARILRLLATEGAQPMVDVRATNLIGVGTQLVAPNLNMIGAQSGVRHRDRVPSYLNNLQRLGLIALSNEPLSDPIVYQVLEAQPYVLSGIKGTSRAKAIRRSISLTPFGRDFCDAILPTATSEIEALGATDPT